MKILVDKMPESPRDCPFSVRNVECGYVCTLRPYIEGLNAKPARICRHVKDCTLLRPVEEVNR